MPMIERIIILEDIDPIVFWYKQQQCSIVEDAVSYVRILARGNVIKAVGDERQELISFEKKIRELEKFSIETNVLKEEDIRCCR